MGSRNLPDLVDGTVSGAAGELTAVEVEARLSNSKSDRGGSRRKRKHSPDEVAGAAGNPQRRKKYRAKIKVTINEINNTNISEFQLYPRQMKTLHHQQIHLVIYMLYQKDQL